tara:strand:- start:1838 stop:1963 length:126 start_codon:yes stop_codon:yes gene_type:complete
MKLICLPAIVYAGIAYDIQIKEKLGRAEHEKKYEINPIQSK